MKERERRGGGGKGKGKERLSVGEQVDVLVDLATDPNVLMRHWVGLSVYI